MAGFANKFVSAKQDWTTPDDIFTPINNEFQFTLDAAADITNARASKFFSYEDNGLIQDWGKYTVWLNPPYGERSGKLSDWIKKAVSAADAGATIVMLIPARTNTNWFHDICLKRGEVRFIRGRPRFGGADHGLPQPLCFVIFRPKIQGPISQRCRHSDTIITTRQIVTITNLTNGSMYIGPRMTANSRSIHQQVSHARKV
jgi:phage N-6-adenine-methyltransferase